MIYVEMYGRLGNQLFRYATARCLQLKFYPEDKLVLNFNQIENEKDDSFKNFLEQFNITQYEKYEKQGKVLFNETNLIQKIIATIYRIYLPKHSQNNMKELCKRQSKFCKILNKFGIYWYRQGYYDLTKSTKKNKFVSGAFEDPRYFNEIRDVLIQEFTPKLKSLNNNHELEEIIKKENSVCVSIRRGDFLATQYKSLHYVCDENYFYKAINEIKKRIDNPVFIMFSDDIEWVKNNIKLEDETYFESGNDEIFEKLRLMSLCKHFIVSNSSFSWWAQYLAQYEEKIVVSPSRWFNNDYESGLICNDWIKIKV